jgi:hypothetical protein
MKWKGLEGSCCGLTPGGTEENNEARNSRRPGRDSNWAHPAYEFSDVTARTTTDNLVVCIIRLLEPGDFYDVPIGKVLHFIRSVGLTKG